MNQIKISYKIEGLNNIDKTSPAEMSVTSEISIPEGIEISGILDVIKAALADRRTEEFIGSLYGLELKTVLGGSQEVPKTTEKVSLGKEILKMYRAIQYKLGC